MTQPPDPTVVQVLLDNHRRFLDFLERRVGSRAEAEDLLQGAFVKALERSSQLRSDESAVAWFRRTLRNALIDHYRSRAVRERVGESGEEVDPAAEEAELETEACRCVLDLLPTLKAEYADLLRRVDLESQAVQDAARSIGILPGNASVRLHRARQALLREVQRSCRTCAEHGCLDCSCGRPPAAG